MTIKVNDVELAVTICKVFYQQIRNSIDFISIITSKYSGVPSSYQPIITVLHF